MLNIHDVKAAYEQAIGHKTSNSTIPRASKRPSPPIATPSRPPSPASSSEREMRQLPLRVGLLIVSGG
jgi:hypothetical protein